MKSAFTFTGRTLFALILASSLLAGCSLSPAPTVPPAPTIDQQAVINAAVQTLSAQITEEAKRNPSPTPTTPPTATPQPTATATQVLATATPAFTATPAPTQAPAVSGQGLYAATFPESKNKYIPNEHFGLALGFKNTGSTPWGPGLKVKLVRTIGETTVQPEATSDKGVEPGGKIEFDLWAFGSETLGQHTWIFQLYSSNGVPIPGANIAFTYTSE